MEQNNVSGNRDKSDSYAVNANEDVPHVLMNLNLHRWNLDQGRRNAFILHSQFDCSLTDDDDIHVGANSSMSPPQLRNQLTNKRMHNINPQVAFP